MASSLSKIANNLAWGVHKIKFKYAQDDYKNAKYVNLNTKVVNAALSI